MKQSNQEATPVQSSEGAAPKCRGLGAQPPRFKGCEKCKGYLHISPTTDIYSHILAYTSKYAIFTKKAKVEHKNDHNSGPRASWHRQGERGKLNQTYSFKRSTESYRGDNPINKAPCKSLVKFEGRSSPECEGFNGLRLFSYIKGVRLPALPR